MPMLPHRPAAPTAARDVAVPAAWEVPERPRPPAQAAARGLPAGWLVERLAAGEVARHREAWLDLMGRALEPNVFLDPDFALPAAQHLGGGRAVALVLIWTDAARRPSDLIGLHALVPRGGAARLLAASWLHDLSTLGAPLLDAARAEAALRALLAWAAGGLPGVPGLLFRALPEPGPTASALRAAAAAGGHAVALIDAQERAVLRRGAARAGLAALSPKSAKELRRQRRRLAERGTLTYASAREGRSLGEALEHFLALEASGWKGTAGTALLARPGETAFVRTASRLLGRRGLWRVDSLSAGGEPVAMALLLRARDTDFLWKIAYRESAARLSPGVQLALQITEAQLGDGAVALTDSCAVPRHPMIDRLWRDRLRVADIAVATRPGASRGFRAVLVAERGLRRLRAGLKRALAAWRAARPGGGD